MFKQNIKENWVQKLQEVHKYAWETWQELLASKRAYKLKDYEKQVPGEITPEAIAKLEDMVTKLPPPRKYAKK